MIPTTVPNRPIKGAAECRCGQKAGQPLELEALVETCSLEGSLDILKAAELNRKAAAALCPGSPKLSVAGHKLLRHRRALERLAFLIHDLEVARVPETVQEGLSLALGGAQLIELEDDDPPASDRHGDQAEHHEDTHGAAVGDHSAPVHRGFCGSGEERYNHAGTPLRTGEVATHLGSGCQSVKRVDERLLVALCLLCGVVFGVRNVGAAKQHPVPGQLEAPMQVDGLLQRDAMRRTTGASFLCRSACAGVPAWPGESDPGVVAPAGADGRSARCWRTPRCAGAGSA